MSSIKKYIFCLLVSVKLISIHFHMYAQDTTDYYKEGFIRYENFIYKPTVHTVILQRNNDPLSDAIINLNSGQQLQLRFDDLNEETGNYYYRFIHCDFNWKPSALHESDYTEGFFYEQVPNYSPSFNTYQTYYHYSVVFPSEQMRITKSGNYIILVYDNENHDVPVITWRFCVVEQLASAAPQIRRATIIEQRNSHQELDFIIDYSGSPVKNPYTDLKIVLQQNGRWDNCIKDLKPLFIKETQAEYNYEEENVFNGGNEFRNFDLRSLLYTTPYIDKIQQDAVTNIYRVILKTERSRSFERYSILDDINGRFLIKIYDGRNDNTESDYSTVDFSLHYPEPLANGNFYVFGALTNWSLHQAAKMKYDYDDGQYKCSLFLKQGYYNYHYVWVEDGKVIADETRIEGNHFETENEYGIYIYHHEPASRYDRLIGFKKLDSRNIY